MTMSVFRSLRNGFNHLKNAIKSRPQASHRNYIPAQVSDDDLASYRLSAGIGDNAACGQSNLAYAVQDAKMGDILEIQQGGICVGNSSAYLGLADLRGGLGFISHDGAAFIWDKSQGRFIDAKSRVASNG